MTTSKNNNFLSGDKPIIDPKDDELEYAPFAEILATSILEMVPSDGLVLGVFGNWGLGKTTFINFIIHFINQKPDEEKPVLIHFNPWWFSGEESLLKSFFGQLQVVLKEKNLLGKEALNRIIDFAEMLSGFPVPYIDAIKPLAKMVRPKEKNIIELKNQISHSLKNQPKRILVVIDDIDRLTSDEIIQLFKVIKAIGNFPNVSYLLAFDKKIVEKALQKIHEADGKEYLEKIIQVSFEMPVPDRSHVQKLFFKNLDLIIQPNEEEAWDKTYWGNVYHQGIDHFLKTPRNIYQLINSLAVTYPSIKGQLNPVDFIAIETLRVFCPLAYDIIRSNPDSFTGHSGSGGLTGPTARELKPFHDGWIERVNEDDMETVKKLLLRIFPKLKTVWGNTEYSADWEMEWRSQRRICSEHYFPVYFRFSFPVGDFSPIEMKAVLKLAKETEAFVEKMREFVKQKNPGGATRLRAFLERFEEYTESAISIDEIPFIFKAFCQIGDELNIPEDDQGFFDIDNRMKILRIFYQLGKRIGSKDALFEIFKNSFEEGQALTVLTHELIHLGKEHGLYGAENVNPQDEQRVTLDQFRELERIVKRKVEEAAEDNSLFDCTDLNFILWAWRKDWDEEARVDEWVRINTSTDIGLIKFLGKSIHWEKSHSGEDVVIERNPRINLGAIEPLINLPEIIPRIKNILEDEEIAEDQKLAFEYLIQVYEKREQDADLNG
jgi:predicted KAP-like P-loop ATPase